MPGTTRQHTHGIATALQRHRPAGSYSSHTPRLQGLKHFTDAVKHREPTRHPQTFPR